MKNYMNIYMSATQLACAELSLAQLSPNLYFFFLLFSHNSTTKTIDTIEIILVSISQIVFLIK